MICDCIMTFLANSNLILQISHAKTFKMRYTMCQYNNPIQIDIDEYAFMCGLNFYETDIISKINLTEKLGLSQNQTK